jgi:hypothetical protein
MWDRIEPGAVHDLGTIVMVPGVLVRGRVVDASGMPLEWLQLDTEQARVPAVRPVGALPPAQYAAARTREGGTFAFDFPLPLGSYDLRLANGYRVASPAPLVLDGSQPVLDIEVRSASMPELPVITGIAVDDFDRPVAGARVTWQRHGGPIVDGSYTNRDGRFTLRCTAGSDAEPVRIGASQYGHETAVLASDVAWGARDVRVRMKRGADFTVRIRDAKGQPVAGSRVRLQPWDAAQWERTMGVIEEVRTDADGQATMTRIVPGAYVVIAQFAPSRGLAPLFERVVVEGTPLRLELRAGTEPSRRLRVQRADGTPVVGTRVELCELLGNSFGTRCPVRQPGRWFQSGGVPSILVLADVVTDAEGMALLRGPAGRALGLRVLGPGHVVIEREDVRLDVAADLVVTVAAGARIHGAVVPPAAVAELRRLAGLPEGESFRAGSQPRLRLRRDALFVPDLVTAATGSDAAAAFLVGEDGTFDVGGLPEGAWSVELCYPVRGASSETTRAFGLGTHVLHDGQSVSIQADLTHLLPGTLQALVQRGGQPWPHAWVVVESSHGVGADGKEVRESVSAQTNAAGRFDLQSRPGRYWLRQADDTTTIASPTIELARGAVMPVTFEFDLGELTVHVVGLDGLPAKQLELHVAGRPGAIAVTGSDGRATITAKPGALSLRVLPKRLQSDRARNELRLAAQGLRLAAQGTQGDPFAAHWIDIGMVTVMSDRTATVELRLPPSFDK